MYAYSWAEGILGAYEKSCTRARQINACIVQYALTLDSRVILSNDAIKKALIGSIQGFDREKLWRDYKRLVKKSPLDDQLLGKVAARILWRWRDEAMQLEFAFDT